MNHPDRIALLDHALGLLEGPRRAEVEAHVQGCPECAEAARALAAEQEALRAGLAAPEVDAGAVERRVMDAVRGLRAGSGRAARGAGTPRRLLVAALVLIAAGAAVLAYRDRARQQHRHDLLVHRVLLSERAALEVR